MEKTKPAWTNAKMYLLVMTFVIAVLLSPLAFLGLAQVGDADLSRMSNIGQAYGFASALISAAALFTVARTFATQARQSRAAEIQALRPMQVEIARLSFEYPHICAPAFGRDPSDHEYMRDVWRTLQLQYIVAGVEVGEVTESDVRNEAAAGLLATAAGRAWWSQPRTKEGRRPAWTLVSRIFDEELQRIDSGAEQPAAPGVAEEGTDTEPG
ncbi:DUF6082 family protein [Actinoplanes sp. NPDC051346]|uniref:DUF6082 family protein n=1 Tax=Actinoplanes sp. NPDC051346 TaxID=3155048 RepID=UPI003429BCCE